MCRYCNETVLVSGLAVSCLILNFAQQLNTWSLWVSLTILICTAAYYSVSFFVAKASLKKLAFYLAVLPLLIGYFAFVYRVFGIIDSTTGIKIPPSWLDATYFSVVTWTTLGYGDFRPSDELKAWVIAEALMGYIYMALLVGKVFFIARTHPNQNGRGA